MSTTSPVIVWFRQDLRLSDNPAFSAAVASGAPVLPIYILDDENPGEWKMGAASRWWLHQSLTSLNDDLSAALVTLRGDAATEIVNLARQIGAAGVYWNRCYEPWRIARDKSIKASLREHDVTVRSFNASLLYEPPGVTKADNSPYKVFTPFFRKGCLQNASPPRELVQKPRDFAVFTVDNKAPLENLDLLPAIRWYREMSEHWAPGERGANANLTRFLSEGIDNYATGRDRPDKACVSRLSPHLHFGEISPHQIWAAVESVPADNENVEQFQNELGWREFSNHLLYHWPGLPRENLQRKFNRFPWRDDADSLAAWQQGMTGIPLVDAGMRELWRTGFMHNRVRMIAASFLVKNLRQHWHHGADWFWDTLVDADLANNSASWQWVAGCGADAAPYFRIFNPVTQGKKFDPDGHYVRRYVPELTALPDKYLHCPWQAPPEILRAARLSLGENYPQPIVDLRQSRRDALDAFQSLRPTA